MKGKARVAKCLNCLLLMFFADEDVSGQSPTFPFACPVCNAAGSIQILHNRVEFEVLGGED